MEQLNRIGTTWHNVTAWESKDIQNLERIEKGSKVHVVGRIRNQRFAARTALNAPCTKSLQERLNRLTARKSFSIRCRIVFLKNPYICIVTPRASLSSTYLWVNAFL